MHETSGLLKQPEVNARRGPDRLQLMRQSLGRTQQGEMGNISVRVLEPALQGSPNPLAGDLVSRLRLQAPTRVRATRPYSRRAALELYERKAAKGDRPSVRTEGYPNLLATLGATPEGQLIVHGVTFADAVYLVFTDPTRQHCLGVLRKRRLNQGT